VEFADEDKETEEMENRNGLVSGSHDRNIKNLRKAGKKSKGIAKVGEGTR
jgi:hypothetical protein